MVSEKDLEIMKLQFRIKMLELENSWLKEDKQYWKELSKAKKW